MPCTNLCWRVRGTEGHLRCLSAVLEFGEAQICSFVHHYNDPAGVTMLLQATQSKTPALIAVPSC